MALPEGQIRLGEIAALFEQNRESFRTDLRRADPLSCVRKPEGGAQRNYNGADVLEYELFLILREQGLAPKAAAERVKLAHPAYDFFAALARGDDVRAVVLLSYIEQEWSERRGDLARLWSRVDTADALPELVQSSAESCGKERGGRLRLGIVGMTVVPLLTAYRRAQGRAASKGYRLEGYSIVKMDSGEMVREGAD